MKSEWMEWVIIGQFASGMFGFFGVPFYIVLGSVVWVYYHIVNAMGFFFYILVQWFGVPVDGSLEQDLEEYTLGNYIDFAQRKLWIFTLIWMFGFIALL